MDKLMKHSSPFNDRNNSFKAEIVADSVSPDNIRITTMQLRYPRFIHSEFMTHRMFSRNASSSRAVPVSKLVQLVQEDPAFFVHLGTNRPGMQAGEQILPGAASLFWEQWEQLALEVCNRVTQWFNEYGLHKQVVNRALEPWSWINVVVTATEWDNFFKLRMHKDAQPEFQYLASLMHEAFMKSDPCPLRRSDWHLPYVTWEEIAAKHSTQELVFCSAARCARTSYLTHDRKPPSIEADQELARRLIGCPPNPSHSSPFEHQARPMIFTKSQDYDDHLYWPAGITHMDHKGNLWSGNFRGWVQERQLLGI